MIAFSDKLMLVFSHFKREHLESGVMWTFGRTMTSYYDTQRNITVWLLCCLSHILSVCAKMWGTKYLEEPCLSLLSKTWLFLLYCLHCICIFHIKEDCGCDQQEVKKQ